MKTILFFNWLFLVICSLGSGSANAQNVSLNIGNITVNNQVQLSEKESIRALKSGLSPGAVISEIYILFHNQHQKYYLAGTIVNDQYTSKAIQLAQDGTVLRAVSGPGIEIYCSSTSCNTCRSQMPNGNLICSCMDPNPGKDAVCIMTTRMMVQLY